MAACFFLPYLPVNKKRSQPIFVLSALSDMACTTPPDYKDNFPAPKNQKSIDIGNGESCNPHTKSITETSPENVNLVLDYNSPEKK
jgi:hypothetical protein